MLGDGWEGCGYDCDVEGGEEEGHAEGHHDDGDLQARHFLGT